MTHQTTLQAAETPIVRAIGLVGNRAKQQGVRVAEAPSRARIIDAIAGVAHAWKEAAEYEDLQCRGAFFRRWS
jgi:hypothetical protein